MTTATTTRYTWTRITPYQYDLMDDTYSVHNPRHLTGRVTHDRIDNVWTWTAWDREDTDNMPTGLNAIPASSVIVGEGIAPTLAAAKSACYAAITGN